MPINKQHIQSLSHLEFFAKQVVEGFITGLHKSPFHGFSVEFSEHRLYNKGESTRHIDWKLFARSDKLFVKRYEEETNLRCQIVIDNSSSMYFPFDKSLVKENEPYNKISFSVYCAAVFIEILKAQRDAVGLTVFSDKVELQTQAKSSSVHHKMLYNELEKMLIPIDNTTHKKTSATDSLHLIADSIHKRSLVMIFSDMFDSGNSEELFSALQHLKFNKHEVILFHVVDKKLEVDFEFENRPYKFIDVETGEELRLQPKEVKDNYQKSMADYKAELQLKCSQYKIDFVECDINTGFNQVLVQYIAKRSVMV